MAFNDIWVDTSALGGHTRILEGHMTSGQTNIYTGTPVTLTAAGTVSECGDDPTIATFAGFALNGPGDGTTAPYVGLAQNWETGTTAVGGFGATGLKIKILIPTTDCTFITQNFSVAGAAFNETAPALSNIADVVSFDRIGTSWGVRAGGTNTICVITDILDTNFKSFRLRSDAPTTTLGANGKPQYWIQFQVNNHQFNR